MNDSIPEQSYRVLARKYRPRTFEDMIGQDAMVTTLTNAFKAGRIAHAFMLTGVRGIGKTTTARLLARALNYEGDTVNEPSTDLSVLGRHCEAIMQSSHMDVLEMDAASRTGVENMRELLDGVRYAPVSARFKVYIIDEVHMLSTGAFNALLKTLEEPPDHAKFIFATTEIRKVPITVLSRCQRFDLRRVDGDLLKAHLEKICQQETVSVSDEGLALIARAAEGSVRDGLSLLDQAIVQSGGEDEAVDAKQVRSMLGLADRVRVLDLFDHIAKVQSAEALRELKAQYQDGAAPEVIMRDLLDICHDVSRAQTLGEEADIDAAPQQIKQIEALSQTLSLGQLTRMWQILLASYSDVKMAPNPLAAAEMALLKLSLSADMPPPELVAQLIETLQSGDFPSSHKTSKSDTPNQVSSLDNKQGAEMAASMMDSHSVAETSSASYAGVAAHRAPSVQKAPDQNPRTNIPISSFEEWVSHLTDQYIDLKYDVERHVRLIRFKPGSLTIQTLTEAPVSLVGRMVECLRDMTGQLWLIDQEDGEGAPTLSEQRKIQKAEQDAKDRAHPAFSHPLLKEAQLIEIRDVSQPMESDNMDSKTVIAGEFRRQSSLPKKDTP